MNMPTRTAVYGFILNGKQELLLLQRSKFDSLSGIWEMPGGKLERGETVEDAVKREVTEETGLMVHVGRQITMMSEIRNAIEVKRIAFSCQIRGDASVSLSSEHDAYQWIVIPDIDAQNLSVSSFLTKTLAALKENPL